MKRVLAVSGGIDSMVLLHFFRNDAKNLIVAHFDHGIRENSQKDYDFVQKNAEIYGLKFIGQHAKLGANCSEARAREARYAFLAEIAHENDAKITTAHHADDLVESVIINLLRGTGWRGLAPMSSSSIDRPFLEKTKSDIYRYAAKHKITFRQDESNTEQKYLRNRVRDAIQAKKQLKTEILKLARAQQNLEKQISAELAELARHPFAYERKTFHQLADALAAELLREVLENHDISLTRPQLARALSAIQSYQNGKKFPLTKSAELRMQKHNYIISTSDKL